MFSYSETSICFALQIGRYIVLCYDIDEEETENDDTTAETAVSATYSSPVSEITFDISLPQKHAVSVFCVSQILLQYYEIQLRKHFFAYRVCSQSYYKPRISLAKF